MPRIVLPHKQTQPKRKLRKGPNAPQLPRPDFNSLSDMLRTARLMYGLPVVQDNPTMCPIGYDSVRTIDGVNYCWPNEEAFKILVQTKYLLAQTSYRKVQGWLDRELKRI